MEASTVELITRLGLLDEMSRLVVSLGQWIDRADQEIREALRWQFDESSKRYRPLTLFACNAAANPGPTPESTVRTALALEMFHNAALIVDDIVDRSSLRRRKATLRARYGDLHALMVAGAIVADAYAVLAKNSGRNEQDVRGDVTLLSELMRRLAVAECAQWRRRRLPLGVADWMDIAREDTGSMFEICARLGARDPGYRQFGRELGVLYHGCDDVADMRGSVALGGGGDEDLRDGILTLPAALAIRDNSVRDVFCKPKRTRKDLAFLRKAFSAVLPEAERVLDRIAESAVRAARQCTAEPAHLILLISYTRRLSGGVET